jgi:hypothetical protein
MKSLLRSGARCSVVATRPRYPQRPLLGQVDSRKRT